MSKKGQPQKGQNPKSKIESVDQQTEPFLKALQKKTRNLSKKLTEIAELQGKDNLKPEQIEKINRKDAILEEIARLEENAAFFKETYAENIAHYRSYQLKELEVLARALAVYHSGAPIPENAKLAHLWRILQQSDKNYPILNDAVTGLGNALKEFANDKKLQKALTTYVEQNGTKDIKPPINQEKIVSDILQEKVEVKKEEPKVEVQPEPKPAVCRIEPPVEKVPEVTEVVVEKEPTPIAHEPVQEVPKAPAEPQGDKPAEEKKEHERKDNKGRDNRDRPGKGRGGYQGNRDNREKYEGEARRQYKPKYQEKREEGREQERSASSVSSEDVRPFKKDEVRKLEDEGFTMVGKPKPKAKDPTENLIAHGQQHGKKFHHHGKPNNY